MAAPESIARKADARALTRLYLIYFISYGIYQPYLNLHFSRVGLSGTQIGVLSSLRPLTTIFVPPLVGYLADRYQRRRSTLALLLFAGVLPYYLMLVSGGFFWLFLGMLLFVTFTGPVIPMMDANALDLLDGDRTRYGLMRRWGSFGYMVAVVAAGQLAEHLGILALLHVAGVALTGAGVLAWLRSRGEKGASPSVAGQRWWQEITSAWRDIISIPGMPAFFVAGMLSAMASTTYYTFFSIFADELGMAEGLIGVAWGTAVVSEIVLLSLSARLISLVGAQGLFATGLTASAVRWLLYAVIRQPYVIVALQVLHGFTFGAMQAGAVTYLHRIVAADRRAGAQTMWAALTGGVAGVAGAYVAGPLADVVGLRPLFAISGLLALAGALIAWFGLRRLAAD